jgi:hypothetical protein
LQSSYPFKMIFENHASFNYGHGYFHPNSCLSCLTNPSFDVIKVSKIG